MRNPSSWIITAAPLATILTMSPLLALAPPAPRRVMAFSMRLEPARTRRRPMASPNGISSNGPDRLCLAEIDLWWLSTLGESA